MSVDPVPSRTGLSSFRKPLSFRHAHWWFALAFAVTLTAFWPTTFGAFGPPDILRAVHGSFAVTWMAMLVAQAWLIEHGRRRAHRWLGRASLVVAPGLVGSALLVMIDSLPGGGMAHFERDLLLTLMWVDLWSLLLFAGLYVAAIANRRRPFHHARFMASTLFVAIVPALGRLYGMNIAGIGGLTGALGPSFWTCEILLLILVLRDGLAGRWRTPWWVTLVALLLIEHSMFAAPGFRWFGALAEAAGLPAVTH